MNVLNTLGTGMRVGAAVLAGLVLLGSSATARADEFQSDWQNEPDRFWIGPAYWSNPLQDWRLADGRLECIHGDRNRNVQLLTHQLADRRGSFETSVRLGYAEGGPTPTFGWAGFRVGIRGTLPDYRNACIHGRSGINAGITTDGVLFFGPPEQEEGANERAPLEPVVLRLKAEPAGDGYTLTLSAHDPQTDEQLSQVQRQNVNANQLVGNVALVSHHLDSQPRGKPRFWFQNWNVSGSKIEEQAEHRFGPILWAMHTLSNDVLKLTAQMAPVGENSRAVRLQIRTGNEADWTTVGTADIDPLSRTATFRVKNWNSSRDVAYRLVYAMVTTDGRVKQHTWNGTIRRDPVDKEDIVVAGFTGNTDTGFPNTPVVEGVRHHDPDLLVFTGDQLYEHVAGYGVRRTDDVELASLDYLRKWYLLGWSFGDLMRDRPTICLPDDHDVYQPNIWGASGRSVPTLADHPKGGYFMPPEWVNMVQRTQCSHMPGPYDPTPVRQGITVYYGDMNYGRISTAIIEDRKFKTGPEGLAPPTTTGRPDHVDDPDFDPQTVDLPEARMLGDRQLKFLRNWAADWRKTDMKLVVSQTMFAGVPNIHGANEIKLVADLDSNGWPQTGRDKALREIRKAFAFHLGGDQHLPFIIHYGVNEFGDAPYGLCVPSIAAGYPRSFLPDEPGRNRQPNMPDYTGEFFDGFGNKMTIWAVANPEEELRPGTLKRLHDKASGYGIVRMHKPTGEITIECWPLLSDPGDPSTQFEGWPKTVNMLENYGRRATGHLPTIEVSGMENPVVQVIDESTGEIVYTLRIRGTTFRPKVFKIASYTVKVGEPGTERMETLTGLRMAENGETVRVEF